MSSLFLSLVFWGALKQLVVNPKSLKPYKPSTPKTFKGYQDL